MSNSSAIAAVTATLRNLLEAGITLDQDLNDTTVTMQPPDKAHANGVSSNRLNIFLYQALPNAAWRNMDMPSRVNSGESAMPPLALNLYFLLTVYGRDNDLKQPFSQQILEKAMRILHDNAMLLPDDLKTALPNNPYAQIERVRLTLQPLSTEEICRLWSGFQTPYRTSVGYEASVVLIESSRPVKAALPVLTRGRRDSGIAAQPDLVPPFPEVTGIAFPNKQLSALLGDTVTITGHHISGKSRVVFRNIRRKTSIVVAAQAGETPDQITAIIGKDPVKWLAGLYTLSLEITENKGTAQETVRVSDEAQFALAPSIVTGFPINAIRATGSSDAIVTLRCSPKVQPEQRVAMLLGGSEVPAEEVTAETDTLKFVVREAQAGSYILRLRVDGADSQIVDRSKSIPAFRDQQVVIP
jgi:hypothetical protein